MRCRAIAPPGVAWERPAAACRPATRRCAACRCRPRARNIATSNIICPTWRTGCRSPAPGRGPKGGRTMQRTFIRLALIASVAHISGAALAATADDYKAAEAKADAAVKQAHALRN